VFGKNGGKLRNERLIGWPVKEKEIDAAIKSFANATRILFGDRSQGQRTRRLSAEAFNHSVSRSTALCHPSTESLLHCRWLCQPTKSLCQSTSMSSNRTGTAAADRTEKTRTGLALRLIRSQRRTILIFVGRSKQQRLL
jgi:hypothetical protein